MRSSQPLNGPPRFELATSEVLALALMQALAGKPIQQPLSAQDARHTQALAQALRSGNKSKALQLSREFYARLISPAKISLAYELVRDLELAGNPDFQIVMDSLKETWAQAEAVNGPAPSLDDALVTLLLAITRSDKNSISYTRIDAQSGKPRPTTFPLTEQLIRNFLAPFGEADGDKSFLLRRCLVFARGNVMGNPAGVIAHACRLRREAFELELAAYQQALARAQAAPEPAATPRPQAKVKESEAMSSELDKLLEQAREPAAQQAVLHSFQVRQLRELLQVSRDGGDFGARLTGIYAQRLAPARAGELASRLASRMKRLMSRIGTWKDSHWQEYQSLMMTLGVWEGEEWLEKWRADRTGKQHIARSGQDYLLAEKPTGVSDLIAHAEKIKDKLKGRQMLSPGDAERWLNREPSQAPPEMQKALQGLARPERLDELVGLAFAEQSWDAAPERVKLRIQALFVQLGDMDLDQIKQALPEGLAQAEAETAKALIAVLELQINKMAALFKKDPRLGFDQVLASLRGQKEARERQDRLNSQAYRSSSAAQYAKYLHS